MPLADTVRVRRRFQRSIRVDTDINPAALEGFICPPSSAESLSGMARQIAETRQGAFTWTGPYGCGKSSLAVALAALLGPAGSLRDQARAAIGKDTAARLKKLLKLGEAGWTVLPVVGSRSNPAAAIASALDSLHSAAKKGRRGPKPRAGVIEQLLEVAAAPQTGGLLVIIDEMGKFLEEAAFGDTDVYFFQELAEAASRSKGRLVVVGILHQAFDDYAHRLSREVRDEWLKIQGRFADIPINVAGEEQVELIARAIEAEARPEDNRQHAEGIGKAIRSHRPGTASDLGARLHECWPLDPVVACLLGPLSRRRFGQNQRSVFGFLNSAEPFGFQEFIRGAAEGARAYGAVQLWDYLRANLEPSILASPDGHRWSLAVDAVERCEARGGDADHLQLVKTIALIDLFKERSGLLPSLSVLGHALPHVKRARLEAGLEDLKAWSIIIYKRHLGAFAVYAGSDFDIDAAVAEASARLPAVDLARLRSLALLQPVLAKRHYHETGAMRWFEVDIAAIATGADRVREYRPQNGATGLFLLLIGTEAENDAKAKRLWKQAVEASDRWPVAVGWTRDSFMIRELAGELLALEAVRAERSELHGDAVARREVNARIARLAAEVEDRLGEAFVEADWTWKTEGHEPMASLSAQAGSATLNAIASHLADRCYPHSPRLNNELLNRIKPSSNAVAAQKELLKSMVERWSEPRLGIEGFPASGGLYASILESTGLHGPDRDRPSRWRFYDPPESSAARLYPMWQEAERLFREAGPAGADLAALYDLWRERPFGVRDGLLPVLAIAFLLSRAERLAVYLDGVFQPRLGSILVDRLAQEPGSVRFRWSEASEFHLRVLAGISDLVAEFGGMEAGQTQPEPIEVARGLVAVVVGLKPWVLRTTRLSKTATQVRNLAKLASDPNKFLLDDLPAVFGTQTDAADHAGPVVAAVREGLTELVAAYPRMLLELEAVMLRELRVRERTAAAIEELHRRAETVRGLTGNYRLDAFATRLIGYAGDDDDIEGIASLAANKPPRDWVDRDVDHARIEIAALTQEFVKAEGLAHVKGREDRRISMAIFIGDPSRPSPVKPDIDVAASQRHEIDHLAAELQAVVRRAGVERDVALAALAELGARLAEPELEPVLPFELPDEMPRRARRRGGAV